MMPSEALWLEPRSVLITPAGLADFTMQLVSGVMPTRGRSLLANQAVKCFLDQSYTEKELVIVDDQDDPSFPDGIHHPLIRYFRETQRFSIGKKRNLAASYAHGFYLAHYDSDDWSAPDRISRQVAMLESSGKAVAGFNRLMFYEPSTGACGYWAEEADNVPGTTMMYRRDWWETHRFKERVMLQGREVAVGEDNHFRYAAIDAKQLVAESGFGLIVARAHTDNTGKKTMAGFKPFPVEQLPAGFPRS